MAAFTLTLMDYKDVVNLAGGITRWQQENRSVVREARYL
jgi:rhodanese-related sulfurtransferase